MTPSKPTKEDELQCPDAHLEKLIAQVKAVTEHWAARHDLWYDACHVDPLTHYNDEPGAGAPLLLLCSDGPVSSSLEWDDENARELQDELEEIGVYLELEDRVTACYHLIDTSSKLQAEFDTYAQWKWTCRLIEADSADVSGDLYQHFANNPDDFHRLPPREFEKLVSSIFAARGWRTELGPRSGDQGVDLRIWQTDPIGEVLTLVQLKRYAPHRPINLEAVAALETHVHREGANRGLFITSSRYLPGVQSFASREKHRLQLADAADLQRWCDESAQATRTALNRALAMDSFGVLIDEIGRAGCHPRLVVGGRYDTAFCIVLKETRNAALLVHIPSKLVSGDLQRGSKMPLLDGTALDLTAKPSVFRATRREDDQGVSYWGQRALYRMWNGQPCPYDFWD